MNVQTDYYIKDDQIIAHASEIRRLQQALRDIAESEPIPNPIKAWEFCRDVARAAISGASS